MFEVVPSLARKRPVERRSSLQQRALGAAALVGAAALAGAFGCGAAVDSDAPRTYMYGSEKITPRSGEMPLEPEHELENEPDFEHVIPRACVVGTWMTAPRGCDCPSSRSLEYTLECAAGDCRQVDVLVLHSNGDASRADVRFSGQARSLSAVGGEASAGEWKYFDDGELMLKFDGNAKYTPTECDEGELVPKGEAPMEEPPEPLLDAITWALWNGVWDGAPYSP